MDKATWKVSIPAAYLLETGLWDAACEATGISPWAVNEGRMDRWESVSMSVEDAERIGLLVVRGSLWGES